VLTARNAAGQPTATAPLAQLPSSEGGDQLLVGDIAAAGVACVEIDSGSGQVLAIRRRSAHAPTVSIVAPAGGTRVGTGATVRVSWRSADADNDLLTATVDYSRDGGKSWTSVATGADHQVVTLPAAYFAGSRNARARVTVDDGFNARARSPSPSARSDGRRKHRSRSRPLAAPRSRSIPSVWLPERSTTAGVPLTGRSVTWFIGRRRVAGGTVAAYTPPAPGTVRLRLVVTDSSGRTTTRTMIVHVKPAKPQITTLRTTGKLTSRSRRVTLRLATDIPSRLVLGRRVILVGPRPRPVSIPIRLGNGRLRLKLTFSGGGGRTVETLTLVR
jgi:hypothetical protein